MSLKPVSRRVRSAMRRSVGHRQQPPAAVEAAALSPHVLGSIDSPTSGDTVPASIIAVAGWVDTGGDPSASVVVRANGRLIAVGPVGGERSDVAAAFGRPELLNSGFSVGVDLLPLALETSQDLHLTADVVGSSVKQFASVDVKLVPAAPTKGYIAAPTEGERLRRSHLGVYGWAVINGRPGRMAEIFLDKCHIATVAIDGSRPDVAAYYDSPSLERSGFAITVDLTDLRFRDENFGDEAVLTVVAIPEGDGDPLLELGPVSVELYERPFAGHLERPQSGTPLERDLVTVYGWAYSNTSPVDSVEVFVDNASVGFARIGLDRLDLLHVSASAESVVSGFELLVDLTERYDTQQRIILEVIANLANGDCEVVSKQSHQLVAVKEKQESRLQLERGVARAALLRDRQERLMESLMPSVSSDLNLLAVAHDLGYGGGQLWLSELLDRAGAGRVFDCTVLAPSDGPLRRDLERLGIRVHIDGSIPVNDAEAYEGRLSELALWSRALGHNAVLVNTVACFGGADLGARLHLPVVWAIHESWTPETYWRIVYPKGYLDPKIRARAEWALGQATAVVFEAEATRQQYLGYVSPDRARVVPYGIRVSAVDQFMAKSSRETVRLRLGFKANETVLLVMGTIEPRKAQTLITEAFARVAEQHVDAKLVFVGDMKTSYSKALHELSERLGLVDRVRIIPVVKDTYSWYRAADALICASDVESLPRSVLEAMCFEVPILATRVFGLGEVLEDGVNGLLYEPRDIGHAAAALGRLLTLSPDQLNAIGRAGRDTACALHDSRGYASVITSLLKDGVQSRGLS